MDEILNKEEPIVIRKEEHSGSAYSGKIEATLVDGDKVIKKFTANTGTNHLFTYLCRCLAGSVNPEYNNLINERPGSIVLLDKDRRQLVSYNIRASHAEVSPEIQAGAPKYYDITPASITYEFLVPGMMIVNKAVQVIQLVALQGRYMDGIQHPTIFAEGSFDAPIVISDNNLNTNLYVRWTLTIQNFGG